MANFFALLVLSGTAILFIKKDSPITETKREAILFSSEVNGAGYDEM